MKTKLFFFIVVIWFLSLGGMVQAQQEKGQGDKAGTGQSPSEYNSYMGGKEHYLTDSPNYMAGKEHYLQGDSFSESGKIGPENVPPISAPNREMESGESRESDDQGGTQIRIEIINVIPEDTANEYGVIYLPVIRPKHHRGAGSLPPHVHPNPPQTGAVNPSAGGGFQQGTMNFR
jgi:hypothetical protein